MTYQEAKALQPGQLVQISLTFGDFFLVTEVVDGTPMLEYYTITDRYTGRRPYPSFSIWQFGGGGEFFKFWKRAA
jgi:hypothetical protein